MTNVSSFDEFDSVQQIAAHQSGLVRVVLEGDTDVKLFKRFWFNNRQDVFDFVEAKTLVTGSGCTAVASAVAQSFAEGVPAIGIVDRDTLFRNKQWSLLFDADPAALNHQWSTSGVYTASLWEIEAYLIEPDLLADWVGAVYRTPPAPAEKCAAAVRQTIEGCRFLLTAAHYFAAIHEEGKPAPKPGAFSDQSLVNLNAACSAAIAAANGAGQATAATVMGKIANLISVLPPADADQVRFLLRYVDTKRLLARLRHSLDIRPDSHWILATFMMREGRFPTELSNILDETESRLAA